MIKVHPLNELDVISRVSDEIKISPGVTVRHVRARQSFGTVLSVNGTSATVLWTQRPIIVQSTHFQAGNQLSQREIDAFKWTADTIQEAIDKRVVADVETTMHSDGRITWDVKAWPKREEYDRGMISGERLRRSFGF